MKKFPYRLLRECGEHGGRAEDIAPHHTFELNSPS